MASLNLKLKPFMVPNFVSAEMPPVSRGDGAPKELPSFPLHALSQETLDQMCDEFRAAVFTKAMKKDPRIEQ